MTPSLLCGLRGVCYVYLGALQLKAAVSGSLVSQEWACLSLHAGQVRGGASHRREALGKAEHWFQSPAAGLGQPHTLHLEACQELTAVQWLAHFILGLILDLSCRPMLSVDAALLFKS